jgi:hypothetical protein
MRPKDDALARMASAAMIRAKAFATEAGAGNRVGGPGQPTGETTTLSTPLHRLNLQLFSRLFTPPINFAKFSKFVSLTLTLLVSRC